MGAKAPRVTVPEDTGRGYMGVSNITSEVTQDIPSSILFIKAVTKTSQVQGGNGTCTQILDLSL